MSLLRIYCPLVVQPQRCRWALIDGGGEPVTGQGSIADLPRHAKRVHLVIPAAQALIVRARIPQVARQGSAATLAFAIEDRIATDPDANQVSWIGQTGEECALAVIDKGGLLRWQIALAAEGIAIDEVHCEPLLLPLRAGEWSMAWDGREGFVRTGQFEAAATDCGEATFPPLVLRLLLDEARAHNESPSAITLYATTPEAVPDTVAWQRELDTRLRIAGSWDWCGAPSDAGVGLTQKRLRWGFLSGIAGRLRPAAWVLGAALTLHAAALAVDWTLLAGEQRQLRRDLETQFRSTFPDTVAVADPVLQMRRKLAEARHGAGLPDEADFLPMVDLVAAASKELVPGALLSLSYDAGQVTLELAANQAAAAERIKGSLLRSGLSVDLSPGVPAPGGVAKLVLIVRLA